MQGCFQFFNQLLPFLLFGFLLSVHPGTCSGISVSGRTLLNVPAAVFLSMVMNWQFLPIRILSGSVVPSRSRFSPNLSSNCPSLLFGITAVG